MDFLAGLALGKVRVDLLLQLRIDVLGHVVGHRCMDVSAGNSAWQCGAKRIAGIDDRDPDQEHRDRAGRQCFADGLATLLVAQLADHAM